MLKQCGVDDGGQEVILSPMAYFIFDILLFDYQLTSVYHDTELFENQTLHFNEFFPVVICFLLQNTSLSM